MTKEEYIAANRELMAELDPKWWHWVILAGLGLCVLGVYYFEFKTEKEHASNRN